MTEDVGFVMGRMQPPHEGHADYILESKERCDYIIIGLTNPVPKIAPFDPSDPERSTKRANPFNYWERTVMVERMMSDHGVPEPAFKIIPVLIEFPQLAKGQIPEDARCFLKIYEEWDRKKKRILESLGMDVEVIYEGDSAIKPLSGSEVRQAIANGDEWQHYVSDSVAEYIVQNSLDERVRKYWEAEDSW